MSIPTFPLNKISEIASPFQDPNSFRLNFTASPFLELSEVMRITLLSRSSIYAAVERGDFPSPVKLTPRRVAWPVESVATWVNSRTATAPKGAQQ